MNLYGKHEMSINERGNLILTRTDNGDQIVVVDAETVLCLIEKALRNAPRMEIETFTQGFHVSGIKAKRLRGN